jgi:hypothetical protein
LVLDFFELGGGGVLSIRLSASSNFKPWADMATAFGILKIISHKKAHARIFQREPLPNLQAQVVPPSPSWRWWLMNYRAWKPVNRLPIDNNSIACAFRAWFALWHNQPLFFLTQSAIDEGEPLW